MSSSKEGRGLRRMRRLASFSTYTAASVAFLIVCGALCPGIPLLGVIGTAFESFFSLHLVILASLALLASIRLRRTPSARAAWLPISLCALALAGSLIPLVTLLGVAREHQAPLSWIQHFHATAFGAGAEPDETQRVAEMGGKALFVDVYRAAAHGSNRQAPAVFMIHGGGFVRGERSQGRNWDRWLANMGYTVFDVDYRLAPPPTWDKAAQDVACAMHWAFLQQDRYALVPGHSLVVGQSAGGSLALQVAYGLHDGSVTPSCAAMIAPPDAVIAFYPAEDLELLWNADTRIGPLQSRELNRAYLGGSPADYPDRYIAASPLRHVRPGVPPTLVVFGEHDHLIPTSGHEQLAAALIAAQVPHELLAIPYGDHGYDLIWGSLGGQITRQVMAKFLAKYYPPLVDSPLPRR